MPMRDDSDKANKDPWIFRDLTGMLSKIMKLSEAIKGYLDSDEETNLKISRLKSKTSRRVLDSEVETCKSLYTGNATNS